MGTRDRKKTDSPYPALGHSSVVSGNIGGKVKMISFHFKLQHESCRKYIINEFLITLEKANQLLFILNDQIKILLLPVSLSGPS
jgi:hypothetical protein